MTQRHAFALMLLSRITHPGVGRLSTRCVTQAQSQALSKCARNGTVGRYALRLDHILLEHRCTPQTRPFVASLLLMIDLLDVHLSSRAIYACCYWVHFNVSSSTDNNPAHSPELTDLSALSCDRLVLQSSTRRIKDWITATSVFFPKCYARDQVCNPSS